ncbi:hypothetical protein [Sphingobium chlorophenolicum]|uniref:SOS response-associated peptidase n=1 Tax=Sphingobium chlorophenolicum TaxID=46429 RepID=A0A081RHV3_SPHCR|nr:hypothetical protein [Sphingobium chlorophenolicum]KEQ54776.1 hypothetical protein BV95_01005 [Sphingobium chlorophenolicum]
MCNGYRLEVNVASIAEDFEELKLKIKFSEGVPNVAPRADIKITDAAPIVRGRRGSRRRRSRPASLELART